MSRSTQSLVTQYELQYDHRPENLHRFLTEHGPLDRLQIQSLVLWQQSQSWRSGRGTPAEEYLRLYPELFADRELFLDLIYSEYLLCRRSDPSISSEQFANRFPDYADDLRQQIEFHEGVGAELMEEWLLEGERPGQPDQPRTAMKGPNADAPPVSGADANAWPAIPGYKILGELGRGGLAVVYLAEDEQLHRRVALKMLLAGKLASDVLLRRMEVEGEAIARLQHPHIVQIFEVGQHDGHPYLVLEYANAGTLAQWMRRQPQSPRLAARLVQQLARTVQFAHDNGILHRDLKPSNVLLHDLSIDVQRDSQASSSSGAGELANLQLKIADFGLAKFINDDSNKESPLGPSATMTGDLIGTAAYMSPEQAKGSVRNLTPATDIYALGAVLYELLTGRPPFVGVDPWQVISQVVNDDPVRPSDLVAHIPRDLETICLKCLHKVPERRYESAVALADELERYLTNQSILARRPSALERSRRWCLRHPAKASSLVFVAMLAILLVGGLLAYSQMIRERLERISTANQRERMLRKEALDRLLESHLSQAGAILISRQVGQRFDSLATLKEAQRMNDTTPLSDPQRQRIRNGVLAALTLPDLRYEPEREIQCAGDNFAFAIDNHAHKLALPLSANQVGLFDFLSGSCLQTIDVQPPIVGLTLNSDATLLGVIGQGLRVYDLASQPAVCRFEQDVQVCAFSTVEPRELLTLDRDASLRRLNIDSHESREWYRSTGAPRQISMSPNGKYVGIRTDDRVEVLDTVTGKVHLRLPPPAILDEHGLVWNPASTVLAIGAYPSGTELWDVPDRAKLMTVPQADISLRFCFDETGSRLLTYSHWGSYLQLWNLTSGQSEFIQKNVVVRCMAPTASGFQLWNTNFDGNLSAATIVTPALFKELPIINRASITASSVYAAYNRDGSLLATMKDGTLELFETSSLKPLARAVMEGGYLQFTPQDELIILSPAGMHRFPKVVTQQASDGNAAAIEFGLPEKLLDVPPSAPFDISNDGNLIAVSTGQSVIIWSNQTGRPQRNLPHVDVRRLSFSPDGRMCATSGWNTGKVIVWDTTTGEKIKQLDEPAPCIAQFSEDGHWLVVGAYDVSLWRTEDWTLAWRQDLPGKPNTGLCVCFSPDSQQLAVSDAMGKIHLLEILNNGQQYAELVSPLQDQILNIGFAPGGEQLVVLTHRCLGTWNLQHLREQLIERDLDWDQRIEKFFQCTGPKRSPAAFPSVHFAMDEVFRQSEALAQAGRAQAAMARFDYLTAHAAIERAVELQLKDPNACNRLAWTMVTGPVEFRDAHQAVQLVQRAMDDPSVTDKQRALYLNTLGVAQYRAGQFDQARATLSASAATQPPQDQPFDLYFLSMCAARLGDIKEAKQIFEKAEQLRVQFQSTTRLRWGRELSEFSREAQELLNLETY